MSDLHGLHGPDGCAKCIEGGWSPNRSPERTPYFADETVTLWYGDALDVATELPAGSVDCVVTSPPYYGLRDYGTEGQYGLEESPDVYVETMRALFSEIRRVLADDGTLWLNIGDSRDVKNMLGIPWRLAFALQDDGWIVRNEIIWHKPNAMPESVTDRLSSRHETVFMFSKARKYWFDLDPIREPHTEESFKRVQPHRAAPGKSRREGLGNPVGMNPQTARLDQALNQAGRNLGDVWSIPTSPFSGAHFAVMPQALASRAIQAGCKPGGTTVLDPFSGSGTTGLAAAKHGRRYVGIDLSTEYLDLSLRTRSSSGSDGSLGL